MTDETPRRRPDDAERGRAELPSGYRSSRRGSRSARKARKAVRVERAREGVTRFVGAGASALGRLVRAVLVAAASLGAALLVLFLLVNAINGIARWNARRQAAHRASPEGRAEAARDNLLVIGVEGQTAEGFLALKVDPDEKRVYGIAIPDGAFMEVPGQGFERIGDSYRAGPDVSEAAVSNYLSVPFESHVVVDSVVYRAVLENQSVAGIIDAARSSDLEDDEEDRLRTIMESAPVKDVAIVPLPVKPITLGDETYFEPQRDQVADLMKTWWGVDVATQQQPVRVLVYNGSGTPGIAGVMARDLIRRGYRVVDTRNADRFDYDETLIVLQHGESPLGEKLRSELGVGKVVAQDASQQIVDAIIIVGKDYAPKAKDG